MERASKLIRGMKLPGGTISQEEVVCAAWPGSVGKTIAAHARAARLIGSHLVVEVEDKIWRRQLMGLSSQILRNLERSLGSGAVEHLEFRVVEPYIPPQRREPQRARSLGGSVRGTADEADSIADPVLRALYRASRKKALA